VAALLVTNAATGTPVALDYHALTSTSVNAQRRLTAVHLKLPAGTPLPARLRVYVMLDAFPLGERVLTG
jgi:hypothetical protein